MNTENNMDNLIKLHNFPPFFTIQPNKNTLCKQLDYWCDYVITYCERNAIKSTNIDELIKLPDLFQNKTINRKLSREGIQLVLNKLQEKGHLEWLDHDRKIFIVMKVKINEISNSIAQYIKRYFTSGTIVTLYELANDIAYSQQLFYGCDIDILKKAIIDLHNSNMVIFFTDDNGFGGFKVI